MTTSTTDAEAIARIVDPLAFDVEKQTFCTPAYWKARSKFSLECAAAILSYLASRREAQEPVAWLRDIDGTGSLHPASKGDPGAFPVYTAPPAPAPAGEAERLRGLLGALWRWALNNGVDELEWKDVRAALNGGRADD